MTTAKERKKNQNQNKGNYCAVCYLSHVMCQSQEQNQPPAMNQKSQRSKHSNLQQLTTVHCKTIKLMTAFGVSYCVTSSQQPDFEPCVNLVTNVCVVQRVIYAIKLSRRLRLQAADASHACALTPLCKTSHSLVVSSKKFLTLCSQEKENHADHQDGMKASSEVIPIQPK